MNIRVVLTCFLMCAFSMPVLAQEYNSDFETLLEINRIQPLQYNEYEKASEMLERNLQDRKKKIIGEVEDIIIGKDGNIQFLNVALTRLRLGSLSLNYEQMKISAASDAYALQIDSDQIKNLYPSLLANVETASGGEDEIFSIRKIMGAPVKRLDGRTIGRVEEVLFDYEAKNVEALYIVINSGTLRGEHIAIPFGQSMSLKDGGAHKVIVVENTMADAMMYYVKDNK